MRDGRWVPQVHLDTQEGDTRGARLAVRGGLLGCPDSWSPASHLPLTCHLCGDCDTLSSATPTGANRCAQCCQVAACPCPVPPAGLRLRTGEEALQRRMEGTSSHRWRRGPRSSSWRARRRRRLSLLSVSLPDRLPRVVREYPVVVEGRYEVISRRAGVPLGDRHIGVTPGEVGHKSVPPAPVRGAQVGEVQLGAICGHLPALPQATAAVQLPV